MSFELRNIQKSFEIPIPAELRAGRGLTRALAPRWRELRALEGVSFRAAPGEAVGVIGANGSGKSTLLKILAGVMTPDSGDVVVNGRVGALLEVGAGFHPDLTGAENVALNAALIGLGRRETEARIAEIIAFSELERFMDTPVKRYSSGMTVRLGFAIAIQLQPEILLLDETFAVGDARFQARALGKIREMKSAGVTMALVSHNTDLILELADRVVWLDHGRVRMDGPPTEVVPEYRRDCGARLITADRFGPARPAVVAGANGDDAKAPWRITSPAWRAVKAANIPIGQDVIEAQSDWPVAIEFALTPQFGAQAHDLSDFEVEAVFTRDDQRAIAFAIARLDQIEFDEAAITRPLRLVIDPIRLAFGEYNATLRLRRRNRASEAPLHTAPVSGSLRITTPLPYDFRLIANLDARWENRQAGS